MSDGTVYNLLRNSDLTRNVLTAVTTAATGKAAYYRRANMGNAADPAYDSAGMHFTGPTNESNPNAGVGVEFAASDLGLINGDTYVLSVEVASLAAADANNGLAVWQHASEEGKWWTGKAAHSKWSSGAGVYRTGFVYDGSAYVFLLMSVGKSGSATVTRFGLYHAASAAWAPAEGETLAGGGALMSANLWEAKNVISAETSEDGVYSCSGNRGVRTNVALDRLAENQTFHCGFSVNPGKDDALNVTLCYRDAAGSVNYAAIPDASVPAGKWTRVSGSVVVPSGMTVFQMVICNNRNASGTSGWKVTNPTLSLGSPVPLASSAHTPYATQDHVSVTYATKASLKVTDDSIKAEVSARAQTDQNVADLSSRLTQTANSLTSEISDRRSAISTVTGLANAAQSTADAAKSSASNAVSTANSASTSAANAVKTANAASSAASSASSTASKASTDAASAVKTANSASSTASSAVSTANSAKSTADAASSTATKAQTMATENQSSIRQLSDSITSEVTERGKLAGRVGTLESTSGTHTSKLEQLATSIKSLVKGESTYTDPDGKSATSGIYSLVTQTRDSVTALFGSYTKTADLASTQAVKDAKKAGTDAQAAASAAQTTANSAKSTAQAAASDAATAKTNAASAVSTANSASTSAANAVETANAASSTASSASSTADSAASTANAAKTDASSAVSTANAAKSTANTAKSTADSLATLIRADSTGITVGKSADGKTWSTGRTHMTADSFDILDKAGKVLSSFGASLVALGTKTAAILLAGILRVEALQTHPATAGGSQQTIDTGRISVPVHAEVGAPWSAIELAGRNDTSGAATTALRAEFSVDNRDGSIQPYVYVDCGMTVDGTLAMADKASALATRKGLRITQGSKVCHGHGTPWVTLFESWSEFQSTTGCYDSSTPTLVTMNGDFDAFDGALSDCEIAGKSKVYVMARATDGPHTFYSNDSVRINWICIW